jgi:hypothetical protein
MPLGRFLGMWLLMAVAMTLNGIGRELLLKRFMSVAAAGGVSAILGIILIGIITRWGFRPLAGRDPSAAELWTLSIALVVLTVGFETIMGRLVDHKSWSEIGRHYAIWRGELWPIVLGWLAATPFVWGRG